MPPVRRPLRSGRRMLSSGGASQPAVNLNVGTFNVGIEQAMLGSKKHREHFRRLLGKAFEEGDLHLLSLCEVGGHKQGLRDACIHPQAVLDGVLPHKEYRAAAMQAYMSVWHATGNAEPDGVSLQLCAVPTSVALALAPALDALDPQLVIFDFRVTAHGHDGKVGRIVQGVLHIRTPSNQKTTY